jgi:hypothetical protein
MLTRAAQFAAARSITIRLPLERFQPDWNHGKGLKTL